MGFFYSERVRLYYKKNNMGSQIYLKNVGVKVVTLRSQFNESLIVELYFLDIQHILRHLKLSLSHPLPLTLVQLASHCPHASPLMFVARILYKFMFSI